MRPCARLAPALLVVLVSGCPSRDISSLGSGDNGEVLNNVDLTSNRNVDILFLIDNSSSMNDKQDLVAANFPRFIDVLNTIPGGLPNVHIGVASSTVSVGWPGIDACENPDDGLLQNAPRASDASRCAGMSTTGTCPVPNGGARYIEDIAVAGGRQKNYDGNLADVFTCIARLGTCGCGYEHHLEGMKRALDGSRPENAGFLRADAYLAVVILGDEDDCSAHDDAVFNPDPNLNTINSSIGPQGSFRCTEFGVECDGGTIARAAKDYTSCMPRGDSYLWDPQHYVDFIKGLKPDPSLVLAAVIAGNTAPFGVTVGDDGSPLLKQSCDFKINGHDNVAYPGVRLKYFADQFGPEHGAFLSICQADYSDALTKIGQLLAHVVGVPCLAGSIDTADIDPSEPGLQIQCEVSDAPLASSPGVTETVLPRCPMTGDTTPDTSKTPCWWTKIDASVCPATLSETNTELVVERGGAQPPVGTHVVARCATKE